MAILLSKTGSADKANRILDDAQSGTTVMIIRLSGKSDRSAEIYVRWRLT